VEPFTTKVELGSMFYSGCLEVYASFLITGHIERQCIRTLQNTDSV